MGDEINLLCEYFLKKSNISKDGKYFIPTCQKGRGVGSILGGLYRTILPLIKTGSIPAVKELVKHGEKYIESVDKNPINNKGLKRKAKNNKKPRSNKKPKKVDQSSSNRTRKRSIKKKMVKKKCKQNKKDIFSRKN
jgi:hypothetical protein